MKTIIILMWLLWSPTEQQIIIINDIIYKMPETEVIKIKTTYNIMDKDVIKFKFDTSSCFTSSAEWIKVNNLTQETKEAWSNYKLKTTPYFMFEGKFVGMEYFNPSDFESITILPTDEAVLKFGCKGLNPIFVIKLQKGKTKQDKPVGGMQIRQ
jgi:hypothetical protein